MAELNLDDFLDPALGQHLKDMYDDIVARFDTASLDYKFMIQMLGDKLPIPTEQALTVIIATRYMQAMRNWDGVDPFLPMTFAYVTMREVLRRD